MTLIHASWVGYEQLDGHGAALDVRETPAGRAVGAAPWRKSTLVRQELDRADMLGGVAVAAVTLVVAVHGMAA